MIVLRGKPGDVRVLTFSPSGRLAAQGRVGVQVWEEIADGAPPTVILAAWPSSGTLFGPDDRTLLGDYGSFRVYDPRTRTSTTFPYPINAGFLYAQTLEGQRVLFVQASFVGQPLTFCRRWDDLRTDEWAAKATNAIYSRPLFLDGGKRFLLLEGTGVRETSFVTRETATGKFLGRTPMGEQDFGILELSPDQRWLANYRGTSHIYVHSIPDLAAAPIEIRNDNRRNFTGVAFHPSGRFLAATSNDNTVKLYDTATWQMAHAFDWEVGRLRSIAFSPDGMLAAAGGDKGKIVVWDFDL